MKKILYTLLILIFSAKVFAQDFEAPQEGIYGGLNGTGHCIVGALGGNVNISDMGGAMYSIPLPLPDGILDMKPSVSVVYNSQSPNDLLGWGWSLSANSAITRIGHTLYHDGNMKGVDFNDDRFALDGKRLLLVNDHEYGTDGAEYRTEVDGLCRIISYRSASDTTNGPAYFKVWHPDGTIAYYGTKYDSRPSLRQPNDAALWLLDSVTDHNGNYMVYHYNYYGGSSFTLDYIKYTGHDTGNPNTAKAPFYEVKFVYDSREDEETMFIGDRALHFNRLLRSIKVYHGSSEIERFDFNYYGINSSSGYFYKRLKDITQVCGTESLNPTIIEWGRNNYFENYEGEPLLEGLPTETFKTRRKFSADFNGDGYTDLITITDRTLIRDNASQSQYLAEFFLNKGPENINQHSGINFSRISWFDDIDYDIINWIYVVDFTNDGYDDFVVDYRQTGWLKDKVSFAFYRTIVDSQGNVSIVRADSYLDGEKFGIAGTHSEHLLMGDFLGRGRTDMMLQIPYHEYALIGHLSPTFLYIYWDNDNNVIKYIERSDTFLFGTTFVAADFNGDGITEIWCSNDETRSQGEQNTKMDPRRKSQMVRFTSMSERVFWDCALSPWHKVFPGDFNGDGKCDALTYVSDGNGNFTWEVAYFMETDFKWPKFDITESIPIDDPGDQSYTLTGFMNSNYQYIEINDFDGDGKSDLALIEKESPHDYLHIFFGPLTNIDPGATNNSLFAGRRLLDTYTIGFQNIYNNESMQNVHSGNFRGKENRAFIGSNIIFGLQTMTDRYNASTITDGMGNQVQYTFDYLMPYTYNYYELDYPNDLERGVFARGVPIKALKTSTTKNLYSSAPPIKTRYWCSNALFHKYGRGFLGFTQTTIASYLGNRNTLQSKTVNNYELEPIVKHRALTLKESISYGVQNKLLSKVEYDNNYMEFKDNPLVFIPIVTKQQSYSYSWDSDKLLNKAITENVYHVDAASSHCYALYKQTIKLDKVLEGVTDKEEIEDVENCQYQTMKKTHYQDMNNVLVENWIINRPVNIIAQSKQLGEADISETLINYSYENYKSYLPSAITTYPGVNFDNSNGLATSTIYEYDEAGNVKKEVLHSLTGTPSDRITSYEYRDYRFAEKRTDPSGFVSECLFNNNYGEKTSSWDCNGLTYHYWRRDHFGSTDWTKHPDQTYECTAIRWALNDENAPEQAVYYTWKRISGHTPTKVFYDASGRELRTVTFGMEGTAIYKDTSYDEYGRIDSVSLPYYIGAPSYWIKYEYDTYHRQTRVTRPDSTYDTYEYNNYSTTVITHPKPNSNLPTQKKQTVLNIINQIEFSIENETNSVSYYYHPNGKLRQTQIGSNESTQINIEYDDAGNRILLHDPNYGIIKETYNAFGELLTSTSPKGDRTFYEYDNAGRLRNRIEEDINADAREVTTWTYGTAVGEVGVIKTIECAGKQSIAYSYDEYLRMKKIDEKILNRTYTTEYQYDAYSRISQTTYPSGVVTQNRYLNSGHLNAILDEAGHVLWQAETTNALGQYTAFVYGNGIKTTQTYDPKTGRLRSSYSESGNKIVQKFEYNYDDFGNLAARKDNIFHLGETFLYDDLNRLTDITLDGNGVFIHSSIEYDEFGRMKSKQMDGATVFSDAQYETYDSNGSLKPHAISGATIPNNPFPTQGQNITYTMFDKVKEIQQNDKVLTYLYGYDHQRITMQDGENNLFDTKVYVGGCEFVVENGCQKVLTYIGSPTGVCAVNVDEEGTSNLYYIYKDHLGSWTAITDSEGEVVQRCSFDAWGNLRNPETWSGSYEGTLLFDRGFTGHEHLRRYGLINMNGRMYDPVMSSFLSVDDYVQQPDNSQSFNRYAYCLNNPLRYTDPSGEVFGADDAVLVAVIASIMTASATSVALNGISNTEHGQPFFQNAGRAAFIGGVQGFVSFCIGSMAGTMGTTWGQITFSAGAHSMLGGCSTVARGGDFLSGAAASLASSLICGGIHMMHFNSTWIETTMDIAGGTLAGGVAEHLMGGDFADGALNGFICAGMNHAMHLVVKSISPDDPPGKDSQANKTRKFDRNKYAVAVGTGDAGLIESAAWTTKEMLKLDFKDPLTYGTKMIKNIKGVAGALGIIGGGISIYLDYQSYLSGSMSWEEFKIRAYFTGGEAVISTFCAPLGFVISTVDACGGFDGIYQKYDACGEFNGIYQKYK